MFPVPIAYAINIVLGEIIALVILNAECSLFPLHMVLKFFTGEISYCFILNAECLLFSQRRASPVPIAYVMSKSIVLVRSTICKGLLGFCYRQAGEAVLERRELP